jgi:hypothetical protein
MEKHLQRVALEIEIEVVQNHLGALKRRSSLRAVYERQLKAARLALMMLDLNWNERRAA